MSMFEEDRPAKKVSHEIGSDISALSAGELEARIRLLQDEIARLEAEVRAKTSSRSTAESLFRK